MTTKTSGIRLSVAADTCGWLAEKGSAMKRLLGVACVLAWATAGTASAQTTGAGYAEALTTSLASVAKAMHATIRRDLAEAAVSMPAEEYGFQPAPETRTFAQLVGHVVNANMFFCSQAGGEKSPATANYEQLTDKAALVKALNASLELCDRAYGATTDATFNQSVKVGPGVGMGAADTVRGAVLMFNVAHNKEHYGNIVVYTRLKGHVPPSTARSQTPKR